MSQNQKDAALLAAQRDFEDAGPTWELQPNEQPCTTCWLVHAGECF